MAKSKMEIDDKYRCIQNTKTSYHVAHFLDIGKKNRMTTEELCDRLDCNRRALQRMVNEDRKNGAWIISFSDETGGYCLAESQEEYESFCEWLIKKQLGSAAFFRRLIKNYDVTRQEVFEVR